MDEIENLTFEEAYTRLSETTQRLESGNLSLDESLALFEQGIALSRLCERLLTQAELRVSQITTAPDEADDPPPNTMSGTSPQSFIDPMLLDDDPPLPTPRKRSGRGKAAQPSFSFDE